jgi:hypothetical protein
MTETERKYIIDQIYSFKYNKLVIPRDLVDNLYLENYKYLKYYKNKDNYFVEMSLQMPDETEYSIFIYEFDKDKYLQNIYRTKIAKQNILWSREKELKFWMSEYYKESDKESEITNKKK